MALKVFATLSILVSILQFLLDFCWVSKGWENHSTHQAEQTLELAVSASVHLS